MNEANKVSLALFVSMEYSPSKFVVIPTDDPLNIMFTKGRGSPVAESATVPIILVN
jgi:hypothetical protein